MSRLPELVAAAKRVIENVDSDALLSYFGMKTDLRQGAPAIKVSVMLLLSYFQYCLPRAGPGVVRIGHSIYSPNVVQGNKTWV